MKTKFKVGELAHVFLNGAAPDGATAGEWARVDGNTLLHDRQHPAASFLSDATGPEGKRVAVIMPSWVDNGSRWRQSALVAAVPPTVHAVKLGEWPRGRTRAFYDVDADHGAGTESVQIIFSAYLAAIEADCMASVASEIDPDGAAPLALPHYVAACNDLLVLSWTYPQQKRKARADLRAMLDRWNVSDTGAYDLAAVRAVATRERLAARTAETLPLVRAYFTRRAECRTLADRLRLVDDTCQSSLARAIAVVLRSGIPSADRKVIPVNMLAATAEDRAKVEKVRAWRDAPELIRHAWQKITGRRSHEYLYRGPSFDTENDARTRTLPPAWKARFVEVTEFARRRTERIERKKTIASAVETAAVARQAVDVLAPLLAAGESLNLELPGAVHDTLSACRTVMNSVPEAMQQCQNASEFMHGRGALVRDWERDILAEGWGATRIAEARALLDRVQDFERANRSRLAATEYRAQIAAHSVTAQTMPRVAVGRLELLAREVGSAYRYGTAARLSGTDALAIVEKAREAMETARAMYANVSETAEFLAGGAAPSGGGDWLRINGRRAVTTRNAEVPTKAVRLALAHLDGHAPGAVDCSAEGFMIGPYQLMGRDENGTVIVGCHRFGPESVALIREQIAAQCETEAA